MLNCTFIDDDLNTFNNLIIRDSMTLDSNSGTFFQSDSLFRVWSVLSRLLCWKKRQFWAGFCCSTGLDQLKTSYCAPALLSLFSPWTPDFCGVHDNWLPCGILRGLRLMTNERLLSVYSLGSRGMHPLYESHGFVFR